MKKNKYRHNKFNLVTGALVILASAASLPAAAVEMGGYFRIGTGSSDSDESRKCFGLSGPGLKYRLGNECDVYGEFQLTEKFKAGTVDYKVLFMTNFYTPETNLDGVTPAVNQLYVEAKGFDVAPETSFWVGERFHGRSDVHIVDTYFTLLNGTGAGFTTPMGKASLGVSYFKKDESATDSGTRFNVDVGGIPVNTNGSLRVIGTLTKGDFTGGENGAGLTLQHTQDKFLGGSNNFYVQYANGSAGLDGNFGDLTADSDVKSWRVVETFWWQKGAFGGQAMALFQNDEDAAGNETESLSVGGRMSYAVTNHFKLVTELGHSEKTPDGGDTQKLTKFTFAPTLSIGKDFWSRPELRFYVTKATWNNAANSAAGAGGITGFDDDETDGLSYGFQVETWF